MKTEIFEILKILKSYENFEIFKNFEILNFKFKKNKNLKLRFDWTI